MQTLTVGSNRNRHRHVMPAIDSGELDTAAKIFGADEKEKMQLGEDVNSLLDWRKGFLIVQDFLRTLQNIQKFDGWKTTPLRAKIVAAFKTMEDWT